jgi:hypothetical protein
LGGPAPAARFRVTAAGRTRGPEADHVRSVSGLPKIPYMAQSIQKPLRHQQSQQSRNKANTRRNAAQIDDYLIVVEKSRGFARAWELRGRLERGEVTLDELRRS